MKKKLLSLALCLCMVLTLLPTAALAADKGTTDSITDGLAIDGLVENDTFTVDGVTYTYGGNKGSSGLDLSTAAPTVNTVYKAGTGTIVFTPADSTTTPATPAKLTLNNATAGNITLQGAYTLALKGANSAGNITVNQTSGFRTALLTIDAIDGATLTGQEISADSVDGDISALNAITSTYPADADDNSDAKVTTFYGDITISGGSISAPSIVVDAGATVTVNSLSDDAVILTAATGGFTNEGTITINNGEMLDLSGCSSVASTGTIVNNGNLGLPADFPVADIDDLHITGSGVVTIGGVGGVTYSKFNGQWMQDVSSKGLDFITTPAPTGVTTYKAGTGTVTFTPAVTTEPSAPAKLVFDGATIAVSKTAHSTDATAITLPGAAVDVTFRGTNAISASATVEGTAFSATEALTFTLEEGSTTTLTATGDTSKVISSTGNVTINGSGALNLKPMVNPSGSVSNGYAIHTTGAVAINGGTVCEQRVVNGSANAPQSGTGGIMAAEVTLGAVTIPAGGTLDLHSAKNAAFSAENPVTNNGTLILPDSTPTEALTGLTDVGGVVILVNTAYQYVEGAWARDVTASGLDISGLTERTVYTAGEGTITFTPAVVDGENPTPATLTLNNATIAPSSSGVALLLGTADIKLVLEGISSLKGFENMAMGGNTSGAACGAVTIGGEGSLTLNGNHNSYCSFHVGDLTLTDKATVTNEGGTVVGKVTVNPGATLNAVINVNGAKTVYGTVTIPEVDERSYVTSTLSWDNNASMVVNGVLVLAKGTEFDDTLKGHLTGSGIVCIATKVNTESSMATEWIAYLTDGKKIPTYWSGLDFSKVNTEGNWSAGATLVDNGYTFTGDKDKGYVLTLGNLYIKTSNPAIILPNDGPVTVVLASGAYTFLNTQDIQTAAMFCSSGTTDAPVTISGSGRLRLCGGFGLQVNDHPLTISGGDIEAYSFWHLGVGASNLTITGGTLTVEIAGSNKAFLAAPKFTGYTPRVTYGTSAEAATTEFSPADAAYTSNKYVKITKYVSSGGGVTAPAAPIIEAPKTEDGTTTVTAEVKPVVSGTTEKAEIPAATVTKAVESAVEAAKAGETAPVVEISIKPASESTAKVEATLPAASIEKIAESGAALTVTTGIAKVSLPAEVVESIAEKADGKALTLTVEAVKPENLTESQKAVLGESAPDAVILDLNLTAGNEKISDLGGSVTISIPVTLDDTQSAEDMVVWFVADDGAIIPCEGSYDAKTCKYIFKTNHFSVYVLVKLPFNDVAADSWYYGSVAGAYMNKLLTGVSETAFEPESTCTRAQAVTILWRAAGSPEPSGSVCKFNDVAPDAYYFKAVLWAVENGITSGTAEDAFSPDDAVTRAQTVTFLWRASGSPEAAQASAFSDTAAGAYYEVAVSWAVENKITTGTTETTFTPDASCIRAEIAAFMLRQLKK